MLFKSKPVLVLLPGMDGTGDLFDDFVAEVKDTFEIQVVRYPTHKSLDYAELEALVIQVLPTDVDYVLLGESFSGPIAISIASKNPPRLKGLVLCCTFVDNPRPALSSVRHLLPFFSTRYAPGAAMGYLLMGSFSTPSQRQALATAVAKVPDATMRSRARAVLDVLVSKEMARIQVPTLYLRATHDRVVPRSASVKIFQLLPKVEIVDVDAPHCLLQTAAPQAAKMVVDFVQSKVLMPRA